MKPLSSLISGSLVLSAMLASCGTKDDEFQNA